MPELPEVETVRRGLERHVLGRRIDAVEVLHPRAVRRHRAGGDDFAVALAGRRIGAARRRGKYLWLELSEPGLSGVVPVQNAPGAVGAMCLVAHLGMSGQLLVDDAETADQVHLRVRLRLDGSQLRFVDQRTFGGLLLDHLVAADDDAPVALTDHRPDTVPALVAHIARDPIDPRFDDRRWVGLTRRRASAVKRTLLDQSLISGVGNIYADEALWRAQVHGSRPASSLSAASLRRILQAVRAVMGDALAAGGTSFDSLYVNVNGQSGYFDRSLAVYGRGGRPCPRCGTEITRSPFMNRSSFWCPRCQPAPRQPPRPVVPS